MDQHGLGWRRWHVLGVMVVSLPAVTQAALASAVLYDRTQLAGELGDG
jgi:hypothetical protein